MSDPPPTPVKVASWLVALEAAALAALALILLGESVLGRPDSLGRALSGAALALFGALVLGFDARGLLRLRPSARTRVVVIEVLAVPVSFSLAFQAGLVGYGAPILLVALAVLYLLFTPPARAALDRAPLDL